MNVYLFSYGTLQLEKVQLETFGRLLKGTKDCLGGYKLESIEITDEKTLALSQQTIHHIAIPSGNAEDKINGVVFEITDEELQKADEYEVDDYKRVLVTLDSGKNSWVYISKK